MTIKMYDLDAYASEFDARVVDIIEYRGKTGYVFDRTLFFPEEGGQSCDKGTVNGLEVIDVQIKGDNIIHFLDCSGSEADPGEQAALNIGDTVRGTIDRFHRFRNMQCHSAEHIFSGLVYSTHGFNNVGFHLSDNTATMDYDGYLTPEEISDLESRTNGIILENRSIKAEYPDSDTLKGLQYRSKKELSGPIRIVTVEGVDVCACCAPHVKGTGEIGFFKVISFEKYKGGVRIHYLAGFRALWDYEARLAALRDISSVLSAKPGFESEAVKTLSEENRKLRYDLIENLNRHITYRIDREIDTDSGYFLYVGTEEEIPCMDFAAKTIRARVHSFALFMGSDEKGYRFVIESAEYDTAFLPERLRNVFGAKCGGKNGSFRGSMDITGERIVKAFSDPADTFGEAYEQR